VKWQLPDGVTADDIQWPMPKRIPIGPLVNYGYEGDVILPVRLHVSPSAVRRSTLPIRADLRWLVCRDICVSGKATLGLSLPLDAESRRESASWRTRIAASRAAVPLAAPGTWQASAVSTKNDFLLTVRMDRAAKTAAFFPLDESRIDDSAPQVVTSDGTVLHIRLRKSDHLVGDPSVLRGVLAIVSGPTAVITAPIDAVGAPQTSSGSQQ
jgi:thiol:disulfide interchange protein DsbD